MWPKTKGLIVALDFDDERSAMALIEQLDPQSCALKVGNEMFTRFGPDWVRTLVAMGFRIFLDLKFHDIPNTVARSCAAAAELGVWMLNVHASGGVAMMAAARNALPTESRPLLIAVTVLTSMSADETQAMGVGVSLEQRVCDLAKLAQNSHLDGVVCSPWEVASIKASCGEDFITVTPGIRLPTDTLDDQSRIMTPAQALSEGSDFLVVGRPITRAAAPQQVIHSILSLMTS